MQLLLYCMLCKLSSVQVNVAFISKHVSVAVVVSLFNSRNPSEWQKNEPPNKHKVNESPAEKCR